MTHDSNVTLRDDVWAVVGSTGFVGNALVRELEQRGAKVRRIKAPRVSAMGPRTVDSLKEQLDLYGAVVDDLTEVLRGASIVINAAGLASPDAGDTDSLFGANSILPAVIARAAAAASVSRFLHMSSAAVQGERPVLDASTDYNPFSPYSASKTMGEQLLLADSQNGTNLRIVRATSVQGPDRSTTQKLQRLASSPFATVARPGNRPSAVSSIDGLIEFILEVARDTDIGNVVQLQRWEGANTTDVLYWAGGCKYPKELPESVCRGVLWVAKLASRILGHRGLGHIRRVEVMWFGQEQVDQEALRGMEISETLRQALLPTSQAPQNGR